MCGTTPSRPTHPRPPRYPHPPAASPRLRSSPRCPAPPTRWPSLAFACHLPRPRVRSRLLPQRRPGWPLSLLRRPTTPHRPATTASAHQLSAAPLVARSAAACLPSQWLCAVCDGAAVSSASQSRHRCRRTCSSPRVERNRSRGRSTCCTMRMESSERGVCFLSGFRIDYFVNNKSLLLIYLDDVLDANTGTVYAYAQSESRNQSTDGLMVITQLLLADLFPPMAVSPCGSLPGAPSAHARLGFSSGASSRRGSVAVELTTHTDHHPFALLCKCRILVFISGAACDTGQLSRLRGLQGPRGMRGCRFRVCHSVCAVPRAKQARRTKRPATPPSPPARRLHFVGCPSRFGHLVGSVHLIPFKTSVLRYLMQRRSASGGAAAARVRNAEELEAGFRGESCAPRRGGGSKEDPETRINEG